MSSICCSILLLAEVFDSASAAIICICCAMIVSNSSLLMDLEDPAVDATEAVGDDEFAGCLWSICVSRVLILSSSCCSCSEGAVILEFVGELSADCVCGWLWCLESRRKPAAMSE